MFSKTIGNSDITLFKKKMTLCSAQGLSSFFCEIGKEYELFPEEQSIIATSVVERKLEFMAGRHAAHAVIKKLGLSPCAIKAGHYHEPTWPLQDVAMSITHDGGWAVAIGAKSQQPYLGVDLHMNRPCEQYDDIIDSFISEQEKKMFVPFEALFSIKEASIKALSPYARRFIDPLEMAVEVDESAFRTKLFPENVELMGEWTLGKESIFSLAFFRPFKN